MKKMIPFVVIIALAMHCMPIQCEAEEDPNSYIWKEIHENERHIDQIMRWPHWYTIKKFREKVLELNENLEALYGWLGIERDQSIPQRILEQDTKYNVPHSAHQERNVGVLIKGY